MKNFYQYITENIDYDDDWLDIIRYNELSLDDLRNIATQFNLELEQVNTRLIKIGDKENTLILGILPRYDAIMEILDYDDIHDIKISDDDLLDLIGINEDSLYIDHWEMTLGDARKHPPTVYHYTTEEAWEEMQQSTHMRMSYGTGLTNRSSKGIFTSIDPETYALGQYGDVCLQIDLPSYLRDSGQEEINLYPEPEIYENTIHELFYSIIELEDHYLESSDTDPTTIIVGENIPIEYVTVID
jgi:hypothetical protein